MLFMKANHIHYSIGTRDLLSIPELTIHDGERIGLVGKNGQGKTLLLQYLLGSLDVQTNIQWHTTKSWMKQLEETDEQLKHNSGGEITKERLTRVFSEKSRLLFLDEPTNNLDWYHIQELEEKLNQHEGAFVVVSHDRMFLDNVCDKIWELDQGTLTSYTGNYTFYEEEKEKQRQQHYDKHKHYVQEKKRIEQRIRDKQDQSKGMRKPPKRMGNSEWQLGKNKAAAQQKKVERVGKNLIRRLERLDKVDKPFEWDQVKMSALQGEKVHRKYVTQLKDIDVSIGNSHLFHIDHISLPAGKKTAMIGKNGSGKTTLIKKLITNKEKYFHGEMNIAYFNQDLDSLPADKTVYAYASEDSPLEESMIRIILARLRFYEEDIHKTIAVLSGGERVKLAMARLLTRKAHLVILDEPTNHLDLEAIHALELLVKEYPGTMLVVTHDRTFIDRTADHLWILENRKLKEYQGTWREWQEDKKKPAAADKKEYDELTLKNKLTAIIGKLSMPSSKDDIDTLEAEYEETLRLLTHLKEK